MSAATMPTATDLACTPDAYRGRWATVIAGGVTYTGTITSIDTRLFEAHGEVTVRLHEPAGTWAVIVTPATRIIL